MSTRHDDLLNEISAEFDPLRDQLVKMCKGRRVYYMPNFGNWGDALINQGAKDLLSDAAIEYTTLSHEKKSWIKPMLTGGLIIYGGGGAWCKYWSHAYNDVRRFRHRLKVIVLPSTYELAVNVPTVKFYARDTFESMYANPSATFMHDMALYLGGRYSKVAVTNKVGNFFRTDLESSGKIELPDDNNDLSVKGTHLSQIQPFFDEVGRFELVNTDRLHVGIAGALQGRQVRLHPGSYFKIQAIYNSTLHRFPNVTLVGQ